LPARTEEAPAESTGLGTAVIWTSLLALGALLAQEGYQLVAGSWVRPLTMGIGALAVVLSAIYDALAVWRAPSRLGALKSRLPEAVLLVPVAALPGEPGLWALATFVRQTVVAARYATNTRAFRRAIDVLQAKPAWVLILSFAVIILLGTMGLTMPMATTDGHGTTLIDALFTSTSAVCVTGLQTVNAVEVPPDAFGNPSPYQTFTPFGQAVVVLLVQIGGLGIMTISAAVVVMAGQRMALKNAYLMQSILDESSVEAMRRATLDIVRVTFSIEGVGAAILFARFWYLGSEPGEAAWKAVFHSVSAFCNAGFALFPGNLEPFVGDVTVNLVHCFLIITGGLGFTVIAAAVSREAWKGGPSKVWQRYSLQVRMVLGITAALLLTGTLLYYFLEYDHSLAGLSLGDKLLASFFQSTTTRTAGFNTVPMNAMGNATVIVCCVLMFIGASPGSTGGGIKTTTLGVLLLSIRASLQGRATVEVGERAIPSETVHKAVSITAIAFAVVLTGIVLLLVAHPEMPIRSVIFECFSALGTVGLSLGITPELSVTGKLIICALMFIGRVGPLTVALAVGERKAGMGFSYPQGRVIVG
jgi:trk system potassium uptake protein TrkH